MGVGKTTIGKALAEKFNYAFYDTDDEQHWDRLGFSRDELFSNDREKFHEVESGILKFILRDKKNSVISTGGSIVLREENIDLMKSSGTIIFLNADAKNIINRINNSDDIKKSVMKGSSLEDTENFLNERGPKYRFANLEIDTSDKSIKEVCDCIAFLNQSNRLGPEVISVILGKFLFSTSSFKLLLNRSGLTLYNSVQFLAG